MKRVIQAMAVVTALSFTAVASAQDDVDTAFFDFDDMLIDGDMLRPDGMMARDRRSANFDSLLNMRRSFLPEIETAAHEDALR